MSVKIPSSQGQLISSVLSECTSASTAPRSTAVRTSRTFRRSAGCDQPNRLEDRPRIMIDGSPIPMPNSPSPIRRLLPNTNLPPIAPRMEVSQVIPSDYKPSACQELRRTEYREESIVVVSVKKNRVVTLMKSARVWGVGYRAGI